MNKLSEDTQNTCDPQLAVPDLCPICACVPIFIRKYGGHFGKCGGNFYFVELSVEADYNLCPTETYYWQAILIRSDMTSAVEV